MLVKLIPYYSMLGILFGCLLVNLYYIKNQLVVFIISIISLFFLVTFAGIRASSVDPDYQTYQYLFNLSKSGYKFQSHVELGYKLVNSFVALFTDDFTIFLLLFLSLTSIFLGKAYTRISYIPVLSVILYYCHYYLARDFIAIRSALAYAICLYAMVSFSKNENKLKFTITVLLASLFHKTALLSLLGLLVKYLISRYDYKKVIYTFGFICLFFLIFSPKDILINFVSLVFSSDSVIFVRYFESKDAMFDLGILNPVNIKNIFIVFISLLFLPSSYRFLLTMFALGSFMLLSLHEFGVVAARSLSQFVFFDTILIPLICQKVNVKQRPLIIALVFVYALLMLTLNLFRDGAYNYSQLVF